LKKKAPVIFILILMLGGIGLSVLNFITPAYARASQFGHVEYPLYGTTTRGGDILTQSFWTNAGRFLGFWNNNNWYCCLDPSNCCIVFYN
jgi:hypothetical protein